MKFEKSTYQKRADVHMDSWREDADDYRGGSFGELGFCSIEKRLRKS